MDCERLLVFLKQLVKNRERKIFLILDNLRVHHGKIIKAWAEENTEAIELFFLPSYSPEKNPDEYLNCDLKRGLSDRPSPKDGDTLEDNVRGHMQMLQREPERVKKYFMHPDIKYAA